MSVEKLNSDGWYITKEAIESISKNVPQGDINAIIKETLNADFKDVGESILASELKKDRIKQLVLQIQKIRNVAAPKSNEESHAAPRMLKVVLTDGHTYCQAIENENIPFLSLTKTAPGTKLKVINAPILSGYILLQPNTCKLLGGRVESMYEKWEVNKLISKHVRTSGKDEGPPPWVSFGQKIISTIDSSTLVSKPREVDKSSSEFDVQRREAIVEASSGAIKKVFGGGVKQAVHQQQINRNTNYPKDRASQELTRRDGRKFKRESKDDVSQKPSENISLFDFLEDKLMVGGNNVSKSHQNESFDKYQTPFNGQSNDEFNTNEPKERTDISKVNFYSKFNNKESNNFQKYNKQNNLKLPYENRKPYYKYQAPVENDKHSSLTHLSPVDTNMGHKKNSFQGKQDFRQASIDAVIHKFDKMTVNSQFASRSLRQHLNLNSRSGIVSGKKYEGTEHINNKQSDQYNSTDSHDSNIKWKIGDQCLAKYWEDNKYYLATITDLTHRTYVVKYTHYGNYEEVLHSDCKPLEDNSPTNGTGEKHSGSFEFRKGNQWKNKQFSKS